ncbi:hypothetical protein LPJ61_003584, partial [Coemansia biformis]
MRKSSESDISPGGDMGPLSEYFKPGSTRARFEELASTYRSTNDRYGQSLARLEGVVEKKGEVVRLVEMAKDGRLPPTDQIVDAMDRLDFGKMREYATTFQGKKIIGNMENATRTGTRAFEEINGEDNAQEVIAKLDSVRKQTVDDRKVIKRKVKQGAAESRDTANIAGKDFLVLAKGVGTSPTFRKSLADFFRLLSDTMQSKAPTGDDARKAADSDDLVDHMRGLAMDVRRSPDMRKSLSSLHALYKLVYNKGSSAMKGTAQQLEDHPAKEDLSEAYRHAKTLFSRLGNGYEMAALTGALEDALAMAGRNEGFDQLVEDARSFGDWAMNADESELSSEGFRTRGQALIDQSHKALSDDERATLKALSAEATSYMLAVQGNPVLVSYKDAMSSLVHSITGHGLSDMERREHFSALRQDVLANLPLLVQEVRYVPLPRIAGQNKQLEFAADNIVLDLKHFVPEHMSFDTHSEAYPRSGLLKDESASRSSHGFSTEQFFSLTITGIHFVAQRVAFYIKKKKGLPRLADKGIADFIVGGRGMDVTMRMRKLHHSEKARDSDEPEESGSPRPRRELDIVNVKVQMHTLDITVREAKHSITGAIALALMKPVARRLIAKSITKALTDALVEGDQALANYSSTAQDFIATNGRKALSSAKDAARRGSRKGKEQMQKARSKITAD